MASHEARRESLHDGTFWHTAAHLIFPTCNDRGLGVRRFRLVLTYLKQNFAAVTILLRNALACLPMPQEDVERIYRRWQPIEIQRLCESHERLRRERDGAESMLEDVVCLRYLLKRCSAHTDESIDTELRLHREANN